jgi:hypothetical protein
LPLLLASFTVTRPAALQAPTLPAAFDARSARALVHDLVTGYPDRSPGTAGQTGSLKWFVDQLRPYGFAPRIDRFEADVAGRGRLPFANVIATAQGRSDSAIVVLAHRDNDGTSSGANDNASGTAALIELARSYANPVGASGTPSSSRRVRPSHKIVFLSTDGGALGGVGAQRFARDPAIVGDVVAVINLDSIASTGTPRVELAGDRPRSPSLTLLATAAARVLDQTGHPPARPSGLEQLIDLGFPFSFYEQAPFLGRGISAVTLTSAGDRPQSPLDDLESRLSTQRLGEIGRSTQQLLASLDEGPELAQGTSTYVYLGSRAIRGWAVELVLITALLPFLVAAVDLFALCRRRRIPLAPALRSFRSRLAFWVWLLLAFEALRLARVWPAGVAAPPPPEASAGTDWPVAGLVLLGLLALAGWLVARDRLLPRRPVTREEELAGHTVALLVLGLVGLLTIAVNPFALIFVLPPLHAWLWVEQLRRGGPLPRLATFAVGFLGPALLVGSFAFRFGLGFDALWYLAELAAVGYVPFAALAIAAVFAAGAGQVGAISVRRYAPYPEAHERPPLGPLRRTIQTIVLGSRARRRAASEDGRSALHG